MSQSWPQPWSNAAPPSGGPQWHVPVDPSVMPGADPRLSYICASGKMTPQLESALIDAELGIPVRAHGLIGMHPQLAFVYMHTLASKMASSAMCPLTDDDFDHIAVGCGADRIAAALLDYFRTSDQAPDGGTQGPELEFVMLALRSVVPKDISSVPVQRIIEVRRRHVDERIAFQRAIQTIASSVPDAISADSQAGAMYLHSLYEKTLEPELRRLKASLNRSGIDSVFGAMSVKVQAPQLITSGAAIFGIGALHLNPIMMGAGAAFMCLVPMFRSQRAQARKLRGESPAAYLLRIEEELTPTSLASGMVSRARRLMAALSRSRNLRRHIPISCVIVLVQPGPGTYASNSLNASVLDVKTSS